MKAEEIMYEVYDASCAFKVATCGRFKMKYPKNQCHDNENVGIKNGRAAGPKDITWKIFTQKR